MRIAITRPRTITARKIHAVPKALSCPAVLRFIDFSTRPQTTDHNGQANNAKEKSAVCSCWEIRPHRNLDCQLFGTNASHHLLVNVLIHATNTLLVFWFVLRTTHARWPSALVAALFALHPLHVESVAWVSERKDTLSTFFGLLSLIAYVRYAKAPSISRYAWVAIALALGLLAKPMLVTWPFVMLLLDYWPLGRLAGPMVKEHRRGAPHKEAATGIAS